MAAGDVLSAAVEADGYTLALTVEGLSTGGSYLLDAANAALQDVSTAKVTLTIQSPGFDDTGQATTVMRTIYGTWAKRQAHPNHASKDETVSGSDVIVRIVLSDYVYSGDTVQSVDVLAGLYTQGGTPSAAASLSGGAVANNSTEGYVKAFGQWDIIPFRRATDDFRLGFIARHRDGIAAEREGSIRWISRSPMIVDVGNVKLTEMKLLQATGSDKNLFIEYGLSDGPHG